MALLPGYHSPQVPAEVRLNTNESPEPPPAGVVESLSRRLRRLALNRYPDRDARELREALASVHGVRPDEVFCGNGSNEVLQCLLLAYGGPGRRALVFEPTYALHAHVARLTGTEVVVAGRGEDFRVVAGQALAILEAIAREAGPGAPEVVMLCSPNNPTGLAETPETVGAVAEAAPGLVVLDEAYAPFSSWNALEKAVSDARLAVVRTFSKTWALAACRLGYVVADPAVVDACERVALPYHLSAIAQAAGLAALEYREEMEERARRLVAERERLLGELRRLPVDVWPSDANFVLLRPHGRPGREVWQALLERSVLVRDVGAWPGLENCLRVTVGTAAENDRFLAALDAVLRP